VVESALFTFTVVVKARDHLWKKSALPFVFCGLGGRWDYVNMVETVKTLGLGLGGRRGDDEAYGGEG
jgi:hypothetical protein